MALAVAVLEELRRAGIRFDYLPGPWLRVKCPFHDDSTPSCDVCTDGSGGFKCHGCGRHGDFITFMARVLSTDRWVIIADFQKRYGDINERIVEVEVVEKYHEQLWKADALREQLYRRAVTDDQIREYRLGENVGKVTIPVKNSIGLYVNIISYAPGAPKGTPKFMSLRNRGRARLYPHDQMLYDKIMLQAGPIKAIAATTKLNAAGIGSVCSTVGETNWDLDLNPEFKDKDVAVCNDIDAAGKHGAMERCGYIFPFAKKVGMVHLPLDEREFPKGDMNDFLAQGGDPVDAYKSAVKYAPPNKLAVDDSEPIELGLRESFMASYSEKRVSIKAVAAAVDERAYHLPKDLRVKCDRKQNQCGQCPVFSVPGPEPIISLPPETPLFLDLMGEKTNVQNRAIQESLGIPECDVVEFENVTHYHVEDIRVVPELDVQSRDSSANSTFMPCLCVDSPIELNETFYFTGKMMPHPKTQVATLVVSKSAPATDALSSFELEKPDELRVFQPSDWSYVTLCDKLDDIWGDMERRVTRIYSRRALHVAIDMAYFSTMFVPNRSEYVKGWVEVLIVGDSSQGKSEATACVAHYYGLGEKVECKNATVAGLVGGLQELGGKGRWFVKWGVFPTHDRRLVILEELKGLSREAFARLTDMRSSGIADIPKIERRRAHARTRIIANSNPRSNRPVSAYNYGVDTIRELIPSLEDIRRFDACIILNREDVDVATLQQTKHENEEPKYDRDLARKLVLWAWTRQKHQVVLTPECETYLTAATMELCALFSDDVPIIDRGSTRHKLCRLATAMACRTFSTDDCQQVIVRECHAKFARDFLINEYSSHSHGYLEYSQYVKAQDEMDGRQDILTHLASSPHSRQLVYRLLNTTEIEMQDLCDVCGWDKPEAQPLLSCLVRNHALLREGRFYRKSSQFIDLLQKALENGVLKDPSYKKEEKF